MEESGENDVDRDSQRATVKSHYLSTVHGLSTVDYLGILSLSLLFRLCCSLETVAVNIYSAATDVSRSFRTFLSARKKKEQKLRLSAPLFDLVVTLDVLWLGGFDSFVVLIG